MVQRPTTSQPSHQPDSETKLLCSMVNRFSQATIDGTEPLEQSAVAILANADRALHGHQRPCRQEVLNGMALRYGLLGEPPITLEETGVAIGVTRERARQIQNKHKSITCLPLWWPQLDRALEIARGLAPCSETSLADELIQRGVTTIRYSVSSLRACAEFSGRPFDLESADGVVTDVPDSLTAVYRATRKLSERQGLATLIQISDEALDEGIVVSKDDVRSLLSASRSVVWLDNEHVTWPTSARNRLVNTLRTLMSVHQPVPLPAARQAIDAFWTYRNAGRTANQPDLVAPTIAGLNAFCQWHDQFSVDEGGISATVPLDHAEELGMEAALLVELIRTSPNGVLDRTSLMDTAEAYGMNLSTVGLYLSFHPAFVQVDRNVWTVRGTEVPPNMVTATQQAARSRSLAENRELNTGTQPDGRPWLLMAVTSNFRLTGVLLRRWLPTGTPSVRLNLTDGRGEPCGTASYNDENGFTHGFGIYIRRFGLRVGEYLYVLADLEEESASITHGDTALADQVTRAVGVMDSTAPGR